MRIVATLSLLNLIAFLVISGCTAAKLEARLEADPQCKPIINPKTGALMPCPGSDKAFYAAAGLTVAKTDAPDRSIQPSKAQASSMTNVDETTTVRNSPQIDCKPRIHQKTGGTLPCPSE
jgi:hypothetical protein